MEILGVIEWNNVLPSIMILTLNQWKTARSNDIYDNNALSNHHGFGSVWKFKLLENVLFVTYLHTRNCRM